MTEARWCPRSSAIRGPWAALSARSLWTFHAPIQAVRAALEMLSAEPVGHRGSFAAVRALSPGNSLERPRCGQSHVPSPAFANSTEGQNKAEPEPMSSCAWRHGETPEEPQLNSSPKPHAPHHRVDAAATAGCLPARTWAVELGHKCQHPCWSPGGHRWPGLAGALSGTCGRMW